MWLPRFACPECSAAAEEAGGGFRCVRCGTRFDRRDGLFRFLAAHRAEAVEAFQRQYRLVREREGYRQSSPEFYRRLPTVPDDDPHAAEWRIRCESFGHLVRHAIPSSSDGSVRILDLGAGNGWLSHRLAMSGHSLVAVDRLDDERDGLGACRHYPAAIAAVHADFDRLPFAPSQFDVVVFNGSLHYSADPAATLAHARQMLAPGGVMAVMDSPMFADERDGKAMVADETRRIATALGTADVIRPGTGFVTFEGLERMTESLGLRGQFVPSNGSLGWRLRRPIARIRLGRAPAAFGVWVAR